MQSILFSIKYLHHIACVWIRSWFTLRLSNLLFISERSNVEGFGGMKLREVRGFGWWKRVGFKERCVKGRGEGIERNGEVEGLEMDWGFQGLWEWEVIAGVNDFSLYAWKFDDWVWLLWWTSSISKRLRGWSRHTPKSVIFSCLNSVTGLNVDLLFIWLICR